MIELIHDDCMNYMRTVKENEFDLAIVDPPYFKGLNKMGYCGDGYSSLGIKRKIEYPEIQVWEVPDKEYFIELKRISKNQIIWGANHFSELFNSNSPGWIVWDKDNGNSSFSDGELAYTSFKKGLRIYKYMWNGMHQGFMGGDKRKNIIRIHPTQKPIQLYDWIMKNYSNTGDKIIDTHLGSGSSAIAAYYAKLDFVGIELHEYYYYAAKKRIAEETRQLTLELK